MIIQLSLVRNRRTVAALILIGAVSASCARSPIASPSAPDATPPSTEPIQSTGSTVGVAFEIREIDTLDELGPCVGGQAVDLPPSDRLEARLDLIEPASGLQAGYLEVDGDCIRLALTLRNDNPSFTTSESLVVSATNSLTYLKLAFPQLTEATVPGGTAIGDGAVAHIVRDLERSLVVFIHARPPRAFAMTYVYESNSIYVDLLTFTDDSPPIIQRPLIFERLVLLEYPTGQVRTSDQPLKIVGYGYPFEAQGSMRLTSAAGAIPPSIEFGGPSLLGDGGQPDVGYSTTEAGAWGLFDISLTGLVPGQYSLFVGDDCTSTEIEGFEIPFVVSDEAAPVEDQAPPRLLRCPEG